MVFQMMLDIVHCHKLPNISNISIMRIVLVIWLTIIAAR